MKVLLIFGHPNRNSYNGAILTALIEELETLKYQYKVKDLYQEEFNPVLSLDEHENQYKGIYKEDVKSYHDKIKWADHIIIVFPIWWMGAPAIVKGWIDRVLVSGFAYEAGENGVEGLLTDQTMTLITTYGRSEKNMIATGMRDAIEKVLVDGTLKFCGFKETIHKNLYKVTSISDGERTEMLKEVKELVKGLR